MSQQIYCFKPICQATPDITPCQLFISKTSFFKHGQLPVLCKQWMLDELLRMPDRAAALGAQALRDCQQRYDPQLIAQQSVAFYRQVIGRQGTTHSEMKR